MIGGERRHAKVEASGGRREELALRQIVLRPGRVFRFRLVLVAARGRGRSIRGRGPGIGRILVVAGVGAAVAAGQLQRLALYIVLDQAVLVVHPVALHLGRQVITLDHREIRGRGVVVVERRRRHPRSLGRLIVRIRGASLVATYLGATQQLLHRGRRRGHGGGRRAATREGDLLRLVVERQVIAAARQGANMRQLVTESETGTIDVNYTWGEGGGTRLCGPQLSKSSSGSGFSRLIDR